MDLLTKADLAAYLNVSVQTVCYLLYSKQLPKIKIGKEYRFLREDIDQWVRNQRQGVKSFSFGEAK